MANPSNISPILADLSQDIAGAIPLELILLWNTSDKSEAKHLELLAPHIRKGTVVSSDSAGLSKLSAQRSIIEVMQLVSQPKEVIHSYGKAVGGESIGVWVADNTQMFYDTSINPQQIIEAMIAAQHEIKHFTVQVGMAIHQGSFLEIGGGLYGEDAVFVEELSENNTSAGDIAITHPIKISLTEAFIGQLTQHPVHSDAFLLDYTTILPRLTKHTHSHYPYPFSQEFFELLQSFDQLNEVDRQEKYADVSKNATVILVKIFHQKQHLMLEEFTGYIVANAYINQTLKEFVDVTLVKSNGDLAIFVTDENTAVEFARKLREKLVDNEFAVNIALSKGEILLFPMQSGYEIAGGPVNIASKLAEDSGEIGKIFIEASVSVDLPQAEKFSFEISKVELKGKYF